MAEHGGCGSSGRPGRGPSWIGMVLALIFLTVAVMGLTGEPFWLLNEGTKWVVTGGIALIGLGMLVSALPKGKAGSGSPGRR